jgi:hypothetical protein
MGVYEAKVLRFSAARAVGRDAVMVSDAGALRTVKEDAEIDRLLQAGISLSGATVLSEAGEAVGVVGAFYLDRETGALAGFQLVPPVEIDSIPEGLVPRSMVHRVGESLVLVNAGYEAALLPDEEALAAAFSEAPPLKARSSTRPKREQRHRTKAPGPPEGEALPAGQKGAPSEPAPPALRDAPPSEPAASAAQEAVPPEPAPPAGQGAETPMAAAEPGADAAEPGSQEGETRTADELGTLPVLETPPQVEVESSTRSAGPGAERHFLIGRRVMRRIEVPGDEPIAEEGDMVTPEMIRRARALDLLLVLSLNVD